MIGLGQKLHKIESFEKNWMRTKFTFIKSDNSKRDSKRFQANYFLN